MYHYVHSHKNNFFYNCRHIGVALLAAISLDNRIVYLFSCISVQSTNIPTSFISPMPLRLIMPIVSLPFTISQTYPPIDTLNSLYYSPSRCVLLFISLRLVSPAPCCLRRLAALYRRSDVQSRMTRRISLFYERSCLLQLYFLLSHNI